MKLVNQFEDLTLTADQKSALTKLETFFSSPTPIFMLKGYAGSGKTTILKGLIEYLKAENKKFALMAPTGRAAKVIQQRTGQQAYTIHKSIYSFDDLVEVEEGDSFFYYYGVRNNIDVANKIFIVDEASMLSDAKSEGEFFRFGSGHLLSDLIQFTRAGHENVGSKIIFVGDPCQLPPVGDNSSKAFDGQYLHSNFNLLSDEIEMKEVKRQGGESGILQTASKIRKSLSSGFFNDFDLRPNGKDIENPSYQEFLQQWKVCPGTKIIVAYKNKTCSDLNLQIRKFRFGNENPSPQVSDIVVMGANNYRKGVFNGEFAVVAKVSDDVTERLILIKNEKPVRLTWRSVELVFPDDETTNKVVSGKVLENYLTGENFLTPAETKALYVDFTKRHPGLKSKTKEFKEAIMQDEYFNCLLFKYGYAVTCHKAQGGEWENVFTIWDHDIRAGFNCFVDVQQKTGKSSPGFYRWAYTAITRASKNLFAINPPFFRSYSTMSFINVPVLNALRELSGQSVASEEVTIDHYLLEQLKELQLWEQPIPLQDHFIRVRHASRKQYIELTGWTKIGYEVRYTFQRENDKATFKTSVNGKDEFKNSFLAIPALSPNDQFNVEVLNILNNLPRVTITRHTVETILQKIDFDFTIEQKFPFTKNLFDDLQLLFTGKGVNIEEPEHHQYKERYTFTKEQEKATLDFEYNGDGFFGRVLPIEAKCNSQQFISAIFQTLQPLKQEMYAS